MSEASKHRQISRELLAEISAGKYAKGGRLPSEGQLIARFHVSRPTVARALRDLEAQGLITRRAGSGTFLKAGADTAAVERKLGLLVPERGTTEILELITGELSQWARAHGYALLFGGSLLPHQNEDMSQQHALAMCRHFIEQKTLGVFFAPFEPLANRDRVNETIAEMLTKAGIPLVLIDRDITPFPLRSEFDLVATDNFAGGFLLANHLIKLGCTRIAFVAHHAATSTVAGRIAGVREALKQRGVEPVDKWVRVGNVRDPSFVRSAVLAPRWHAVVCANDHVAAELLRTLDKSGVRVPRDIRVVGFDDANYAALLGVSLTTIHQPCREIGVVAFDTLVDRISDPTKPVRSAFLNPRIVVRESCGAFGVSPGSETTAPR